MIRHTFQILERVSAAKEKLLWKSGISDWDAFLKEKSISLISNSKKPYFDRKLLMAKRALNTGNSSYFSSILPSPETWRLYNHFKDNAVYLDIEASRNRDINVIGMYDGIDTRTMVKDINLDYVKLSAELRKYQIIITFNGSSFDMPLIRKRKGILPDVPHIDLRHCCARIGMKGGLKEIEKNLGIKRREIISSLHGGDAATLWRMYMASGDKHYLEILVEYNEEDVISLKKIMGLCYDELSNRMLSEMRQKD
ncbi:ribonuclease H-like domain-containing protein [Candidatus Woesearchaeota archaeon]|nr:ribonuclease H-like domain-containing protein [Candidatus Woesearchaeota archaeon]